MAALGIRRTSCSQLVARMCARSSAPCSPLIPQVVGRRGKAALAVAATQASSNVNKQFGVGGLERTYHGVLTGQRRSFSARAHEKELRQAFQAWDVDNSGAIDIDELRAIFTGPAGGKFAASAAKVDKLFNEFDENRDGALQFEEFQALWGALAEDADVKESLLRSSLDDPAKNAAKDYMLTQPWRPRHVAVIGAGMVGSNTAFCVMTSDIGHGKVTLTDVADELVKGQVMDLEDLGGAYGGVSAAGLKEAGQADIIIVSAGRGVREGETRLDCLKANHGIMKSIIDGMQPIKKSAIMLVVSNPCDILTYYAWEFSGLPSNQVIGSGTLLDTIRLRNLMSETIGAHVDSIQCDVLGEHGDSQFAATSLATVGGIPLTKYCDIDVDALLAESSKKGAAIRVRKGATAFGVATSTKTIVESIFKDQRKILPVSVKVPDDDMYLSLPAIIGYRGVEKILDVRPHLNAKEKEKWQISIDTMKGMMIPSS